jgi:hypothetical protein
MRSERGKTTLRCAVYTRVSTDRGLEQEFNSLDNQREASDGLARHLWRALLKERGAFHGQAAATVREGI